MADQSTAFLQQPQFQDPEYQQQLAELQRKQKIADLLTQQGFTSPQGQMVGNRFVAPSWSQYANQLFSAYSGRKAAEDVQSEQVKLAQALKTQETQQINKYAQLSKEDPSAALTYAMQSSSPTLKGIAVDYLKTREVAPGGSLVRGGFGSTGMSTVFQAPEKLPAEIQSAAAILGLDKKNPMEWTPQERKAIEQKVVQLKQAGAPSVSVSTGKDLAGQVGDIMKNSATSAQGAYQTVQSADKILSAVDKAYTGKGAEVRLTAAQLADTLGVNGKDSQEKLNNTRQIMQETAKLALAAPPRGQGAVSDYERALFAKAAGGDVNLTPSELRLIANRAKEGAQYTIQSHQQKLKAMANNPETAQLVPYYSVQEPQSIVQPSQPVQPSNGGWRIK